GGENGKVGKHGYRVAVAYPSEAPQLNGGADQVLRGRLVDEDGRRNRRQLGGAIPVEVLLSAQVIADRSKRDAIELVGGGRVERDGLQTIVDPRRDEASAEAARERIDRRRADVHPLKDRALPGD